MRAARAGLAAARPDLVVRSLAYSTSETGPLGYQCRWLDADSHHVYEDAVVVELVDESTGEAGADGHAGEVVATPLTDTGMALVRYRIGDRGRFGPPGRCRCGSRARTLTLLGRTAQSILVDGTVLSADLLLTRLAPLGVTDPADCQLHVLWTGAAFRLRLLLCGAPAAVTAHAVDAQLRQARPLRFLLDSPRCGGLSTVEHVDRRQFATTARGKTPLFHQAGG